MTPRQLRVDDGDERDMASTESELTNRNPSIEPDLIRTLVQRAYDRLTPAKLHSYLPVLIFKDVQEELAGKEAA